MPETMIGRVLKDTYRIYERVGSGGFATIYLGRNLQTNQVVAVKVLKPEYTEEPRFVERFRREADMAHRLQHPNVVRTLDYGLEDGQHFLVMEYLPGKSLSEVLREKGTLSVDEAVSIGRQVGLALQAAAQAGIVHRDVKPGNLMVLPAEREGAGDVVKVMDFGIAQIASLAKLTETGMFLGTPRYLAPEVARGKPADSRSDLYALGLVLYEVLAGRPPFSGQDSWEIIRQQVETPPPPLRDQRPEVPAWLETIVARLLAKHPQQRYQTPAAFLEALQQASGAIEIPVRILEREQAAPAAPLPRPRSGKQRLIWGLVGLGALLVLIAGLSFAFAGAGSGGDRPASASPIAAVADVTPPPATSMPTATMPTRAATSLPTATLPPETPTPQVVVVVATDTPTPRVIMVVATATITPVPPTDTPTLESSATPVPELTRSPTPLPPTDTPQPTVAPLQGKILYQSGASRLDVDWGYTPIHLRDLGTGQESIITGYGRFPALSAGGTALAYEDKDRQGIVQLDLTTWAYRQVTQTFNESPVSISSSGEKITYRARGDTYVWTDGSAHIVAGMRDRSHWTTNAPTRPCWAAGDGWLAYAGVGGIYRIPSGGGESVLVVEDGVCPSWSATGKIAFVRNYDIYVVNEDGTGLAQLTDHAANDYDPAWSPDGNRILFVSERDGNAELYVMDAHGGNLQRLTHTPEWEGWPSWGR